MNGYLNINLGIISQDIDLIFPDFSGEEENIAIFSPHDDDALIGAGYAIRSALLEGAKVYIVIFCKGNAGYSDPDKKSEIIEIRREETFRAYEKVGIARDHIIRLEYSDFSVSANMGWHVAAGMEGSFEKIMKIIRENKITRILIPNHYREHVDHTAVSRIGSYDGPQAGDPILADWGAPQSVRSILEYSVWADLSPEDALVNKRNVKLRANRMIIVPEKEELCIEEGIAAYVSQGKIIKDIIKRRKDRRTKGGSYVETYLSVDPRPVMDYRPYTELADKIIKERNRYDGPK